MMGQKALQLTENAPPSMHRWCSTYLWRDVHRTNLTVCSYEFFSLCVGQRVTYEKKRFNVFRSNTQHILLTMSHFAKKVLQEPVTKNGIIEPSIYLSCSTQLVAHTCNLNSAWLSGFYNDYRLEAVDARCIRVQQCRIFLLAYLPSRDLVFIFERKCISW